MPKLGYMACSLHGETIHLAVTKNPRKALLDALGATNARKVYRDDKGGKMHHIGYIVRGSWYTVYEVHSWEGRV